MEAITVAALFTVAGAAAAALIIRQLVELLKAVIPALDAKVSGALQAFVLSAALYLFAAIALPVQGADGVLLAIVSWLGCATAAVGIDASWTHFRNN
jgi:hypothetical protein